MRISGLLLVVAILAVACSSHGDRAQPPLEGWDKHIIAYKKIVSYDRGLVGYIKVFRYEEQGHGSHYDLYHVFDLNFRERGVITPQGRATKYVYLPSEVARVKGREIEKVELPIQPLEWNAAKLLDIKPGVEVTEATAADLKVGTEE